jgi:putative transposase
MTKSYKYRIYPNRVQIDILHKQFNLCRWLHNVALEHRITAYKSIGKNISYLEQANELPAIKEQFHEFANIHSQVLQDVLKRLDLSFQHFFRRIKNGETPGFPRFKGKDRFNSICYPQSGFKIVGNKVGLSKIGSIKIKLHRKIEGTIKTCSIKKSGNQWYIIFTTERNIVVPKKVVSSMVGIDLGLETFAVLSDGSKIENPRFLRNSEEKLKEIQSKYSKYKGNATKKKLSALYRKIANQRNDFLHKQSRIVVNKYGLIVYEDLNIKQMTQGRFAKSIHDAGWGKFIDMIKYKAESAGVYAIAVNPRNTSQICSGCGTIVKKEINQRSHDCPVCGLSLHRDLNASLNILRLGTDRMKEGFAQVHQSCIL